MSVKVNVISNIVGTLITAAAIVVATPFYLRYLGTEAFGLVGVFTTLLGIATVLDLGLTPTLTRELARLSAKEESRREIASTVRTLEVVCVFIAAGLAIIFYWLLPFLALYWLPKTQLNVETVQTCLQWMGLQIAFQLPLAFYTGGLMGLQHQTSMNVLNASFAAARALFIISLLALGKIDVVDFFQINAAITALHLLSIWWLVWHFVPEGSPTFNQQILLRLRSFALSMLGVTALSTLLTQVDKILLSRLLTLEQFGYYVMIWNISMLVIKPAIPIFNAFAPKLTQLTSTQQVLQLAKTYHQGCQLVNILVVPAALVFALLATPLLTWYTGSVEIAQISGNALSILIIGSACNALMLIPYALSISYGWTRFALMQNAVASIVIVPITWWGSMHWGITGAAMGWLLVNLGYIVISMPFLHKYYLRDELQRWYIDDNLLNIKNYKTLWGFR